MAMPGIKKPDILQTVQGSGVDLRQRGRLWWAQCPFHPEKTASFSVNPEGQRFKCFGCGESGDTIDFVQKLRGISFPEALRVLHISGEINRGQAKKVDPLVTRRNRLQQAFQAWADFAIRDLQDLLWMCNLIDSVITKPEHLEIAGLSEMYLDRECAEYQLGVLTGNDFGAKVELFKSREEVANCNVNMN